MYIVYIYIISKHSYMVWRLDILPLKSLPRPSQPWRRWLATSQTLYPVSTGHDFWAYFTWSVSPT